MLLVLALGLRCDAFDFSDVRQKAAELGSRAYAPYSNTVPDVLLKMDYGQHQAIRFKSGKALWKSESLPFRAEFFHPGYLQRETVNIYEITGGVPRLLPAGPSFYEYGQTNLDLPPDLGHAGFRIVSSADGFGEVAVFLGASYFRMLGAQQSFGASGRGLAIGTGAPGGEEFPVFRDFWLQRPELADKTVQVLVLMDSPSVAGAYRFNITPGSETVALVDAVLYPRVVKQTYGFAPLTSMFLHGKNGRAQDTDFRPEVHDSDGLLIHNGRDEWIWHSLEAGKMLRINSFADENPQGFGLMQRERRFDQFQDLIARFEKRPSVWVVPRGAWGKGAVQLVQIPSHLEFQDNVVAFWVPETPQKPGIPISLQYELHWTKEDYFNRDLGYVRATRVGRVVVDPPKTPANLRFVIDFGGAAIESLSIADVLTAEVTVGKDVKFIADSVYKNDVDQTWRLVIEIADPGKAADLKALLKYHEQPITETWTYTWQP